MVVASLPKQSFWKGKKVFLTGHTGFKGSWFSLWLQNLDVELAGYSKRSDQKPGLFNIAEVGKGMTSVQGDMLDFDNLKKALNNFKPEIVVNMAAQSLVPYSYSYPRETFATNVMGTVNLLEAVRLTGGVRVFVNVTSDKCYENTEKKEGYSEEDNLGGYDPYSSSKSCAEIITSAYRQSFFNSSKYESHRTAIASVRSGNVIGGGDFSSNRLIPDIERAIDFPSDLQLRNPYAVRPWQHVLEPLRGYLLLIEKLREEGVQYSSAWNFGPDEKDLKSVEWIVNRYLQMSNEKINWEAKSDALHETQFLKLDCTKARTKLGWHPVWNVDDALRNTIKWYKAFKEKKDMYEFTTHQIKEYQMELVCKKV